VPNPRISRQWITKTNDTNLLSDSLLYEEIFKRFFKEDYLTINSFVILSDLLCRNSGIGLGFGTPQINFFS
jgi:hypothetical protein